MENDNGVELSLGLFCGGPSGKTRGKASGGPDSRGEESGRGSKAVNDFDKFLHASTDTQDSATGFQRSDSANLQENFFNDLSKATNGADGSISHFWVNDNNKSAEIEGEKLSRGTNKRKYLIDEVKDFKKHEKEAIADMHDKAHISITEDVSTTENEDGAESGVDGGTFSRRRSLHGDGSIKFSRVGPDVLKEVHPVADANVVASQRQKRLNSLAADGYKLGNMSYGVPFSSQSMNVQGNVGGQQPRIMVPAPSNERSSIYPGDVPLMFGYRAAQLPMLDKDNLRVTGRCAPSLASEKAVVSDAMHYTGRTMEVVNGEGKTHLTESPQENTKGSSTDVRAKDSHNGVTTLGSLEYAAIKPGIAAELVFGGSGTCPNLPWVSTTGSGPNGRTVSGVTYRFSANQVKIVCACHGSHMSPEEFVRHASEEYVNPQAMR